MNGDFAPYYCQKLKRHIWVLGYFGGGPVNFSLFKQVALHFSNETGLDIDSICIDEIFKSRRFKRFKFVYSLEDGQKPIEGSKIIEDAFKWLQD